VHSGSTFIKSARPPAGRRCRPYERPDGTDQRVKRASAGGSPIKYQVSHVKYRISTERSELSAAELYHSTRP